MTFPNSAFLLSIPSFSFFIGLSGFSALVIKGNLFNESTLSPIPITSLINIHLKKKKQRENWKDTK